QHKPLVITKTIDKATPLLANALVTNENLTQVVITLRQGGQAVSTIKLTNASISARQQHGMTESISFTYQKIEWTWIDGGITAEQYDVRAGNACGSRARTLRPRKRRPVGLGRIRRGEDERLRLLSFFLTQLAQPLDRAR